MNNLYGSIKMLEWTSGQANIAKRYPINKTLKISKNFCQANAIKYLCRYGKKLGKNRNDLLKAIHYVILLINQEDEDDLENDLKRKLN